MEGQKSFYNSYVRYGYVGDEIDDKHLSLVFNDGTDSYAVVKQDQNVKNEAPDLVDKVDETIELEGFKPDSFDNGVVINTQGTAVVNVYFKRIEYTIKFIFAQDLGNKGIRFIVSEDEGLGGEVGTFDNCKRKFTVKDRSVINYFPSRTQEEGGYYYIPVNIKYGAQFGTLYGADQPNYDEFSSLETYLYDHNISTDTQTSWILMANAGLREERTDNPETRGANTVKGKIDSLDYLILGNWKSSNGAIWR